MQTKITIHHVTRIEGHARITLHLDEAGKVARTQFHVTQLRGFEKLVEGRPFYEMPAITARICGICPVSHSLASVKAGDTIMAVRIPRAAAKLRELLHCAQILQSHALSFFHLSGPDLVLGMDSDPAARNIAGLLDKHPDIAKDGIALRKIGQQAIERLAGERIHPAWAVPGGVNAPLGVDARDAILGELPLARSILRRTLRRFKEMIGGFDEEIAAFGTGPTLYAGLVDAEGTLRLYDGILRVKDADGNVVANVADPLDYGAYIGEAALPDSYLKAPYFKPGGYPQGVYRVGPLARLNVAERCGTPDADVEFAEYHERFGKVVTSAFHYHYARLIEATHAAERMEQLLEDPEILSTHLRATADVNALEGVGIIEAPRGTLIHHYRVNPSGAITWANLIVATGHNNLALGRSIEQVGRRFVNGARLEEGMLNRVQAVVRAYDPCLSCSTHALGRPALRIELLANDGAVLDVLEG